MNASEVFQCPGETQSVSHSVHLGRLTSYYPACRECPHRHETGSLGKSLAKKVSAVQPLRSNEAVFTDEAIVGVHRNQLAPSDVRRIAGAFASYLREQVDPAATNISVVIAGDSRPLTPELIAAAGAGLRLHGCHVIDIGATTAPCVALAMRDSRATGGLLIGNPTSDPHHVGLALWGPHGKPVSGASELVRIHELLATTADRPTRSYGGLERRQLEPTYLADLANYFHALRPLRFVLDTGCRPLVRYLKQLSVNVGCEVDYVQDQPRVAQVRASRMGTKRGSEGNAAAGVERLPAIGRRVQAWVAHFGLWIDGHGEICRFVDERGELIPGERLLPALAAHLLQESESRAVVVEQGTSEAVVTTLQGGGAKVVRSGALRSQIHEAMVANSAVCGGGPSGRIWIGAPLPCPDALRTLALFLTVLSQSDRSLSEVVA
jgi:phosphomannomutase